MPAAALLLALLIQERDVRPSPGAVVSGRVSDQASGRPLPRMVATLVTGDRTTVVEAVTDADGHYQLSDLAPGKYGLIVSNDEHRSTYLPQWFGDTSVDAFGGVPQPNIELAAGEVRSGLDVALTRAVAIEGRVLDPWDAPMADVEVAVTRADRRSAFVATAFSDDLGTYRVYGLPPGRYRVCATVKNRFHMPDSSDGSTFVRTCHPASLTDAGAADVSLASNDASGIDIRLQRIGSRSISGVVLDAAGTAVDGASVSAVSANEARDGTLAVTRGGTFVLKDLLPGRYLLRAAIGETRPDDPNPPARDREIGYARVDLTASETADVTMSLSKGATLRGIVTFEGSPAPRAGSRRMLVQARAGDPDMNTVLLQPSAPVRDDLTFELNQVNRLPLVLAIEGIPDGWALRSVRYDGRDITHVPTDFGERPSPGRLELLLTNHVARPSVRVTDDRGVPFANYYIVGLPADRARWALGPLLMPGEPTVGVVRKLGALLPGDYVLAALSTDDWILLVRNWNVKRLDDLAGVATPVTLAAGDERTIELKLAKLPDAR
jgi:hypothetical protein